MFSGAGTPPPKAARAQRRGGLRSSRATSTSSVLQSGQTTPRGNASPPPVSTASQRQHVSSFNVTGTATTPRNAQLGLYGAPSTAGSRRTAARSVVSDFDDVAQDTSHTQVQTSDRVLVKDECYAVLERRSLPAETAQLIVEADQYTEPYRATLDAQTGFALLVGRDACYVWNWSKRSSTTTYVFPLDEPDAAPSVSAYIPLSFATFVPSSAPSTSSQQREPGLVTVSITGNVQLWESISMALSGVNRFKRASTPLNDGEIVRGIEKVSASLFVVYTSQARLFGISVSTTSGRTSVNVRLLDRSVGWASSVWSSVFGGRTTDPRAGVRCVALSVPASTSSSSFGTATAYALSEKTAQVWSLPTRGEGGERLLAEMDLFAAVLQGVVGEPVGNEQWAINSSNVEILDAKALPTPGQLAVLASYTPGNAGTAQAFTVVTVEVGQTTAQCINVRHLTHKALPDPRPLSSPKLVLSGSVAFVSFVDVVVALSLEAGKSDRSRLGRSGGADWSGADSTFEEVFPLRSTSQRFIGTSTADASAIASGTGSLSLLTSMASIMTVQISQAPLPDRRSVDTEAFKTRKLKTKMEQAIFFGAGAEGNTNPLTFVVDADAPGDLVAAAQAVSSELLSPSSPLQPVILELKAQIADRLDRAKALIEFIGTNSLLPRLSQTARRQLSWDAERLEAALALWTRQNARQSGGINLVTEAVHRYMAESGEEFTEDPVRTFFRRKVASLGNVLETVSNETKMRLSGTTSSQAKAALLLEANEAFVVVYGAASRYRRQCAKYYGLFVDVCPTEPWFSRPALLERLQWHFETTETTLRELDRQFGSSATAVSTTDNGQDRRQDVQSELKSQMVSLAEHLFSAWEERILFLRSASGDGEVAVDVRAARSAYLELRPRFIHVLVQAGKVSDAYELAERHQDFAVLVELCNHAKHGSSKRLEYFMGKYGESFAFPLYEYYVEKGLYRTLLEQDDAYRSLLTRFLDETKHDHIAWLNDVATERFDSARDTLVTSATREPNVAQRKTMLSLGKLAQVAQATRETLLSEPVQRAIEAIDDKLDLVNTQEGLREVLAGVLSGPESRPSVQQQAAAITSRVARSLSDRPVQTALFTNIVADLLQGSALSSEDLIDVLSLKDNVGEQATDYASALEVLVRAQTLPEARQQLALRAIWRRVYLHDDWNMLHQAHGLNDEELADALRQTALYSTLVAAAGADHPDSIYLDPRQSLFKLDSDELVARFLNDTVQAEQEMDQDDVEEDDLVNVPARPKSLRLTSRQDLDMLEQEFERENEIVLESLERYELDRFAQEIVRLVKGRSDLMT
ncbi:hypothetical protein ACM66B_005039 [Microbotryomycetes sp. NB124-2]